MIRRRLTLRSEIVRMLAPMDLNTVRGGVIAESTGVPCISYFATDCCRTADCDTQFCWPAP